MEAKVATKTEKAAKRQTLSIRETAKILGVGINQCYAAARAGTIPSIRVGDRVLVPRVALERKLAGDPDKAA
jgi:excisionase family DNA binding protein